MQLTRNFTWLAVGLISALPCWPQVITSSAGDSTWARPIDVAVDSTGNQYVADLGNHVIYKVDRLAATTIVAGTLGVAGYSGDGGVASSARLNQPYGVAIDTAGNLYIADSANDRIRKVDTRGMITTIAGTATRGFLGDGGSASSAQIYGPAGIRIDRGGTLYFVDSGNIRIRRITASGTITTVAGTGRRGFSGDGGPAVLADINPEWLALGPDGSVYFSDDGSLAPSRGNARVRKIAPDGTITTAAGSGSYGYSGDGGPAIAATFVSLNGVAVDSAGNLYIAEFSGLRVRKVAANGIITTYAGTGQAGSSGDGGPAASADLNGPAGLAADAGGNLYIADSRNGRIRKVAVPPGPNISATSAVFSGKSGFSSNMYMDITGTNLSQSTRAWTAADFNGSTAPTLLDGVSVTVNGKPAFIRYVSPAQIGIITPDDTTTGPMPIQAQAPWGAGNVATINRARLSPTLETTTFGGKEYVLAQTPDFRFYVGSPNVIDGSPFTDVKQGDTVIIYALGCGPTDPPTPAGTIAAQDSAMTLPFELRIGGIPAGVVSAVVAASTIGLYQFTVTIPRAPAGDQPIELIVDGVSNAQNLTIVVGP